MRQCVFLKGFIICFLLSGCSGNEGLSSLDPSQLAQGADLARVARDGRPDGMAGVDMARAVDAGMDMSQALTLSSEDVRDLGRQFASYSDSQNRVAGPESAYAKRLDRLVSRHQNEEGLALNYKVYLSPDINAFAVADGSIRVYSGLMDVMNDQELLSIIGHEVGHIALKHSERQTRVAYAASGLRKGAASAAGSVVGALAQSEIGGMFERVVGAQYSQSQEYDADRWGFEFMQRHGYDARASVSALEKLKAMEGGSGGGLNRILSSHPGADSRAERLKAALSGQPVPAAAEEAPVQQAAASVSESPVSQQSGVSRRAERDIDELRPSGPTKSATLRRAPGNVASAPGTSGTRAPAPSSSVGLPQGWYVQLSAETNMQDAQEKLAALGQSGFPTRTQEAVVRGTRYIRVLVGPFANRAQASERVPGVRSLRLAHDEPFVRKLP